MSEVKRFDVPSMRSLTQGEQAVMGYEVVLASDYDALAAKLAMAEDAAAKGDAARHQCGGMEMEIQELKTKLAELEKQEPVAWGAFHFGGKRDGKLYTQCETEAQIEAYILDMHRSSDSLTLRKGPLYAAPVAQAQHSVPDVCDSKEQNAFEDWASKEGMNMERHPLHWLFLDAKTYSARQGWKAALKYARNMLAAAPVFRLSRSALTEAQMRRLYENSTETENERLGFEAFARLIRRAEAVHQIAAAPGKEGV
ncbi:hypothetical protein L4P04_006263 [Pseudomonas aeruginosa]|nr:hypothetical protein [Pseudomonas aeruginosa]EKV3144062.1 hypothetical protein [Pseudomonas aeruginosa]